MFIERAEVGEPGDFDGLNEQELRDTIKQQLEKLVTFGSLLYLVA